MQMKQEGLCQTMINLPSQNHETVNVVLNLYHGSQRVTSRTCLRILIIFKITRRIQLHHVRFILRLRRILNDMNLDTRLTIISLESVITSVTSIKHLSQRSLSFGLQSLYVIPFLGSFLEISQRREKIVST